MRRVLVALVVAVVVALVLFVVVTQRDRVFAGEDRRVDHSTYQAVFLVSSQVYFARLERGPAGEARQRASRPRRADGHSRAFGALHREHA
jgi:hypothetical protein